MKSEPVISVVDVSHHYGVRPVLSHISLEIRAGEFLSVMGPNGVGKSTLLGIVAGLIAPAHGQVVVNGLARRSSEAAELSIRKQMAFLPDQPWLPEFKTGREWLMAIGQVYEVNGERLMEHISRVLDLFQLAEKGDSPIRTYSNGQKKKIAICGVLVTEAPLLVLDEPFTGGLDPAAVLALGRVLKHLVERQAATVIMASQIAEMVEPLGGRIAILEGTRVKACDTLEGLRARTGCQGSLPEVFETLTNPRTLERIAHYFSRPGA